MNAAETLKLLKLEDDRFELQKELEVYKKALKLASDMLTQHCCREYECNIDCFAAMDIPFPVPCGKLNWEETLLRKASEENG